MPSDSNESPLASGSKLDGYELLWPVGEGGMASVWVARLIRKHGFEKLVAIKTILPKFAEDESFQKMFLDEARIASRIDHPNVAHIHDLGEKDDVLYLVMEYVDGDALTRLRKVVNKKGIAFPVGIALRVMADTCSGLHAAHELNGVDGKPLGVVHRDVSPQNILVTADGLSKVIDFGVAKAAGRLTAETHTGYVKGKVQYMAPEQALGKAVDRRADLWAVGAVLYHLIANRPPYEADNQLAMLNLLQKGKPPSPLPPNVPPPVAEIIKKALTHPLAIRFQSASEMRAAIDKTGLAASQDEVAAFMKEHLGEIAARRRGAIAAAVQSLEAAALAAPLVTPPRAVPAQVYEAAGSTQKIDPSQLPQFRPFVGNNLPLGRPPPPSDPRIGPPTPHSFLAASSAASSIRRTEPVSTPIALPMQHSAQSQTPPPQPISRVPGGVPTGTTGTTEPLPPPEQLYDNAFNDNTNGGGSLGLGSISSSVKLRRPTNVPLIAAGVGGAVVLLAVIAIAVGMKARAPATKKFDSQFSPLPSGSMALPEPETTVAAPAPAQAPSPSPSLEPAVEPSTAVSAAPATAPKSTFVPGPMPAPVPAVVGSGRKKPRVNDGF